MGRSKGIIRRYTSISAVIDTLRRGELTLLDPATWDDRNDRYFMELYKDGLGLGGLYAACATTCFETYHHWRVFTAKADGACIELLRDELEQGMRGLADVRFGEVKYLRLDEVEDLSGDNLSDLPFVKRFAFAPEEEYRIIAETEGPQEPAIGLRIPLEWVSRILLNPWLPEPVADSVKASLREIDGCETLMVERSHMIENARWKRAGEVVVGVRPQRRKRY